MWVVRAFQKTGDDFVTDLPLADFAPDEVRPLLDVAADDPMYDAYPVTPAVAAILNRYLTLPLDLDSFDWFLEYDAPT